MVSKVPRNTENLFDCESGHENTRDISELCMDSLKALVYALNLGKTRPFSYYDIFVSRTSS